MITLEAAYGLRTYEQVRAEVAETHERAAKEAKDQGIEICTCGVDEEAKLAGLPVEQLKGVAIGLTIALEQMIPLAILFGADSPLGGQIHKLIHAQKAAVELAGSDEFEPYEIEIP
ncbi:MAG: hypothetical protein ACKO0Z_12490 [Betaproteobacteria bacterium]